MATFGERLRGLRNKRYDDWFYVVIGGPIATFLTAFVADVRWITPNGLTLMGFIIRMGAVPLAMLRTPTGDAWAMGALLVSAVMDAMDGSLARYRRQPSYLGGFLDKVTDVISLLCVCAVMGWRAALEGGGLLEIYAGIFIGGSYAVRCYIYWIVAYYELERGAPATTGPRREKPFGDLTFKERLVFYVRNTWRILLVGEGDIYLYLSLGLFFHRIKLAVDAVAIGMAVWFLAVFTRRLVTVIQLDRSKKA
jgi:phosphatidylglycerophosphate synthase